MRKGRIPVIAIIVVSFSAIASMARAAQDKYSVKNAETGGAFSEFKGYEWMAGCGGKRDANFGEGHPGESGNDKSVSGRRSGQRKVFP